ncbi:MAG: hypothetical protein L0228_02815 [Planctomycetes bacterium]|nr:hypothetical protein [Planctomycetota bacterium]
MQLGPGAAREFDRAGRERALGLEVVVKERVLADRVKAHDPAAVKGSGLGDPARVIGRADRAAIFDRADRVIMVIVRGDLVDLATTRVRPVPVRADNGDRVTGPITGPIEFQIAIGGITGAATVTTTCGSIGTAIGTITITGTTAIGGITTTFTIRTM